MNLPNTERDAIAANTFSYLHLVTILFIYLFISYIPMNKKNKRKISGYQVPSQGIPIVLPLISLIAGATFPSGIRFIRPNDATISVGEIFFTVTNPFFARQLNGIFTSAQPGDNGLQATLRKNGVDTSIFFSINAGFQNPVPVFGNVLYSRGDTLSIKINNLSASASGTCTSITVS